MPNDLLARKIQHLQDQVQHHAEGQTDLAQFEQAILAQLLDLGKLLTEEFIEQKKVHSAERSSDRTGAGTAPY